MMSTVAVVLHTASFVARNKVVVERLLPSLKLVSSFLKVSFRPFERAGAAARVSNPLVFGLLKSL